MWDLLYYDYDEDPIGEIYHLEDDSDAKEEYGNRVPSFHGSLRMKIVCNPTAFVCFLCLKSGLHT